MVGLSIWILYGSSPLAHVLICMVLVEVPLREMLGLVRVVADGAAVLVRLERVVGNGGDDEHNHYDGPELHVR